MIFLLTRFTTQYFGGNDPCTPGPQPGPEDLAAAGPGAGEAELEAAMQAAERGGAQARPGSPDGSSPSSTPPPSPPASRSASRAASPAMPRPASPTAARWEELVRADCTEGDEDELVETMAARLLKAHEEDEAHRERRRALQARAALNARKGNVNKGGSDILKINKDQINFMYKL